MGRIKIDIFPYTNKSIQKHLQSDIKTATKGATTYKSGTAGGRGIVAVIIENYMQAAVGTTPDIRAGYLKGDKSMPSRISGGMRTNFQQAFYDILDLSIKNFSYILATSAAKQMYLVLCNATENAPFWDESLVKKKRPINEGPHLRESGIAFVGARGSGSRRIIANVKSNSTGSALKTPPTASSVKFYKDAIDVNSFHGRRQLNFYVDFTRITPEGFDLAMWIHENLAQAGKYYHGDVKYLSKAFAQVDPVTAMKTDFKRHLQDTTIYGKLTGKKKQEMDKAIEVAIIGAQDKAIQAAIRKSAKGA